MRENTVAISSARKDKLMEQRRQIDKQQEGTTKPTEKPRKFKFLKTVAIREVHIQANRRSEAVAR